MFQPANPNPLCAPRGKELVKTPFAVLLRDAHAKGCDQSQLGLLEKGDKVTAKVITTEVLLR